MKKVLALFVVLAMMLGCMAVSAETATETATGTATVQGFGGDITVTVVLDGADIKEVTIEGAGETPGIGQKILEEWPNAFLEYNGIVDTYSGATFAGITREAVIAAMPFLSSVHTFFRRTPLYSSSFSASNSCPLTWCPERLRQVTL